MKVSIAVISYNAEETILETLESIIGQTYELTNLELVISDDCSKDNTILVVENWLKTNKDKFYSTKLIKSEVNQGVSKNCNASWKTCSSDWIKTIAADDILLPNCILDNVNFVKKHPDTKILFSYMEAFDTNTKEIIDIYPYKRNVDFFEKNAAEQYKILLKHSFNFAPTSFMNRKYLAKIGYADERFKLIEDLPLWLRFTSASIPLRFMHKITVKYRIGNSITSSTDKFANINFEKQLVYLYKTYVFPNLKKKDIIFMLDKTIELNSKIFIAKLTGNKKNKLSKNLYRITHLCRPYWYRSHLNTFLKNKT